jgi:hypothetical protein
MRLQLLIPILLTIALLGCDVEQPQAELANGLDIHLPDGASLALDGPTAPESAAVPTAAEVRATSPSPVTDLPAVARYQGGGERIALQPMDQPRRFHLAWLRITIPQPDGSSIVSQSHRATGGDAYWAEPSVRRVAPGDAVPVP